MSDKLRQILKAIQQPYMERVPMVAKIQEAMLRQGYITSPNEMENDHIAFRTIGVPALGVKSLAKIFMHYGYRQMEYFYFENKKIDAWWYAPPADDLPRIFISELRITELSETAQKSILKYTDQVQSDPVNELDLEDSEAVGQFFQKPLWSIPAIKDYETLTAESEYASWVIYNRYYLNHYTIAVHSLQEGKVSLEEFNDFLLNIGVKLNNAGGLIKTSPDGLLRQSSTVAELVQAVFKDGEQLAIPGSYVEFAERKPLAAYTHLPKASLTRKHRREGFETGNADKIFESTFSSQTAK